MIKKPLPTEDELEPVKAKKKSKGLATAAWYSGASAKQNNKQRVVPDNWQEYTTEWLTGYDDKELRFDFN